MVRTQGEEKTVPTKRDASSAKFQLRVRLSFCTVLVPGKYDAETEKMEKAPLVPAPWIT